MLSFGLCSFSQDIFRIEADFSLKEKSNENIVLTIGKVYYDANNKKIIYDIKFPEKEIIVIDDTSIVKVQDLKIISQIKSPDIVTFSIFNLILSGDFYNYGLSGTNYSLQNIEKEKGKVISTWSVPEKYAKFKGDIMLLQEENKLGGIISFSPDGKMISKQLFEEYSLFQGVDFPTRIVQFIYLDNIESVKITTFKNVVINNIKDEMYNYNIPAF